MFGFDLKLFRQQFSLEEFNQKSFSTILFSSKHSNLTRFSQNPPDVEDVRPPTIHLKTTFIQKYAHQFNL